VRGAQHYVCVRDKQGADLEKARSVLVQFVPCCLGQDARIEFADLVVLARLRLVAEMPAARENVVANLHWRLGRLGQEAGSRVR
jgi:hypothetical protein